MAIEDIKVRGLGYGNTACQTYGLVRHVWDCKLSVSVSAWVALANAIAFTIRDGQSPRASNKLPFRQEWTAAQIMVEI